MSKLDDAGLRAQAESLLSATPDESGNADYVFDKGSLMIAAEPKDMKSVFKKIKKVPGYRWVMINKSDLFAANNLSIGSKAGLIAEDGSILKAADVPRKKI